jgi:type I restriction enzyme S subunit
MGDAAFAQAAAWPTARVGDICKAVNGRAFKPSEWTDKGIPIIRIQNLKNPEAPFNHFAGKLEDKFKVKAGDLLFAWSGTPGTSFGAHIWHGPDAALNQHIFNLHYDQSRVDGKYFCYALNRNVADYVTKAQGGVGLAHITKGKFENSAIPLPPLDQQQLIVAEIEKQFSRLDEAVANLKRVKANLKRYKAAVLKAAVEGRLVETEAELARKKSPFPLAGEGGGEGQGYETGEQLLQRLLKTRRQQWLASAEQAGRKGKGKYKEPAAPDTTDLLELPEGWVWASLDSLLHEPLRNGHSAKATDDPNGLRAFTLSAVTVGDFSEANTKRTVADREKVAGLWAQPGDIYIERSNTPELVGTARLYRGPANFAFIPDLLIRVRVCEQVLPEFVEITLLSDSGRSYFKSRAQGISGSMPKIDQSVIERFMVPLPPLMEQQRIVAEVDRRLSLVREVEAQIDANLVRGVRLRQAILGGVCFLEREVPWYHDVESKKDWL